jgi:hypothetical protein
MKSQNPRHLNRCIGPDLPKRLVLLLSWCDRTVRSATPSARHPLINSATDSSGNGADDSGDHPARPRRSATSSEEWAPQSALDTFTSREHKDAGVWRLRGAGRGASSQVVHTMHRPPTNLFSILMSLRMKISVPGSLLYRDRCCGARGTTATAPESRDITPIPDRVGAPAS